MTYTRQVLPQKSRGHGPPRNAPDLKMHSRRACLSLSLHALRYAFQKGVPVTVFACAALFSLLSSRPAETCERQRSAFHYTGAKRLWHLHCKLLCPCRAPVSMTQAQTQSKKRQCASICGQQFPTAPSAVEQPQHAARFRARPTGPDNEMHPKQASDLEAVDTVTRFLAIPHLSSSAVVALFSDSVLHAVAEAEVVLPTNEQVEDPTTIGGARQNLRPREGIAP